VRRRRQVRFDFNDIDKHNTLPALRVAIRSCAAAACSFTDNTPVVGEGGAAGGPD